MDNSSGFSPNGGVLRKVNSGMNIRMPNIEVDQANKNIIATFQNLPNFNVAL